MGVDKTQKRSLFYPVWLSWFTYIPSQKSTINPLNSLSPHPPHSLLYNRHFFRQNPLISPNPQNKSIKIHPFPHTKTHKTNATQKSQKPINNQQKTPNINRKQAISKKSSNLISPFSLLTHLIRRHNESYAFLQVSKLISIQPTNPSLKQNYSNQAASSHLIWIIYLIWFNMMYDLIW